MKLRRAENSDCALKYEQPLDTSSAPESSWEKSEAPLPLLKRVCNFIHPKQLSPFPERLELPFPDEEILSGYEEDVSFIRDRFNTWVKGDPNTTLERHMVDVRKAFAEFREPSVRRQEASPQEYFSDSSVATRSHVQKKANRLQLVSGTSTWKQGAIEKRIAGKCHIITLQEAIEYVDHELLANRFHVTHYGGCAVLFNKDTLFSDVKVKSIYLHDTWRELPD